MIIIIDPGSYAHRHYDDVLSHNRLFDPLFKPEDSVERYPMMYNLYLDGLERLACSVTRELISGTNALCRKSLYDSTEERTHNIKDIDKILGLDRSLTNKTSYTSTLRFDHRFALPEQFGDIYRVKYRRDYML